MQFDAFFKSLSIKQKPSQTQKASWQDERYESLISQRNIFLFFSLVATTCIIVTTLSMVRIVSIKRIDPFVIQIDQSSGAASIVNPLNSDTLSGYDSLSRYFIKKYIEARETYNPVDFDTTAKRYIKISSTDPIYSQYIRYISAKDNDPRIIYGAKNTTSMKTKSWSNLSPNKYICRFSIIENAGDTRVFNKIAIVEIDYQGVDNIPQEDLDMNPVGFKVINYRVDDDNS